MSKRILWACTGVTGILLILSCLALLTPSVEARSVSSTGFKRLRRDPTEVCGNGVSRGPSSAMTATPPAETAVAPTALEVATTVSSTREECDDFNTVDGDDCSSTCRLETLKVRRRRPNAGENATTATTTTATAAAPPASSKCGDVSTKAKRATRQHRRRRLQCRLPDQKTAAEGCTLGSGRTTPTSGRLSAHRSAACSPRERLPTLADDTLSRRFGHHGGSARWRRADSSSRRDAASRQGFIRCRLLIDGVIVLVNPRSRPGTGPR